MNDVLQPTRLLREGNGLLNVGFASASVGGAALGGLLVDIFGVSTALLVDAASFAVMREMAAEWAGSPAVNARRASDSVSSRRPPFCWSTPWQATHRSVSTGLICRR